ncbi:MAG: hypothetical protein JW954_07215 [Dehalococcoidaceae bacterium]|nr:hypothetical protein [Dehalococcoidaceae bacterium]
MAETVKQVQYYYVMLPDKAGEGARILKTLKQFGIELVAFVAFPEGKTRAQLDFVPVDGNKFTETLKRAGYQVTGPKTAFLIQGEDRTGALADILERLAGAHINVTALQAIRSGEGRYGAILWVKPRNTGRAWSLLSSPEK